VPAFVYESRMQRIVILLRSFSREPFSGSSNLNPLSFPVKFSDRIGREVSSLRSALELVARSREKKSDIAAIGNESGIFQITDLHKPYNTC
jgi:hypothetical protein